MYVPSLNCRLVRMTLGMALLSLISLTSLLGTYGNTFAQEVGMRLSVEGAGVSCAGDRCEVPADEPYTVAIQTDGVPAQGYVGMATHLYYADLTHVPASVEEENVWPENELALRSPSDATGTEGIVTHAGATSIVPQFETTTFEGALVELSMRCPSDGAFALVLLGYDQATNPAGSTYVLEDTSSLPLRSTGTVSLDANGDTTVTQVPVADVVDIICGTGEGGPGRPPISNGAQNGPDGQVTPGGQDGTPDADGTQAPTSAETPSTGGAADQTGTAEADATATAIAAEDDDDEDDDGGVPVWVWIVIVVAVVAALGGGYLGWRYWQARQGGGGPPIGPATSSPPSTPPGTDEGGGPDGP